MLKVVLLPGMDGTGTLFAPFITALEDAASIKIITYPTDQPLGYAALECLIRDQLPANEPFVLVAESFSGPIAIALAATPPAGLLGVVLCCSFTRNPRPA